MSWPRQCPVALVGRGRVWLCLATWLLTIAALAPIAAAQPPNPYQQALAAGPPHLASRPPQPAATQPIAQQPAPPPAYRLPASGDPFDQLSSLQAQPWSDGRAPQQPWSDPRAPRLAVYPNRPGEEIVDEFSPAGPPPWAAPPRRKIGAPRRGMFQKLRVAGSWVAGDDISEFGLADIDANITFAFPFPTPKSPLIITPGFQSWWLEGPTAPDMPARVYDAYLKFRTMRKLNERWGLDAAVTPGWHSDFETSNDDALRITGHAFGAYQWNEVVQVVLGVVYLDRSDVSLLPAVGLICNFNEDTRLELILPRPRFARRFYADCCEEYWWYVAGEFGGGAWAIERASGVEDMAIYRDFRVMLGWERKVAEGFGSHFEIAYVFGREIEYDSGTPDFEPDDTLMLRTGIMF